MSSRGHQSSHPLWNVLAQIKELAVTVKIRDDALRRSSLYVGQCPGLWRTYYAVAIDVQTDEPVTLKQYLGIRLPTNIRRRDLGKRLERWISQANHFYNSFLEEGKLACLDELKGDIKRYYVKRARQHLKIAVSNRRIANMSVNHTVRVMPQIPLIGMSPDGVFAKGRSAAIFESKLSEPAYEEFAADMAAYAMAVEYELRKDVDHVIVLHSDYPHGRLGLREFDILDSDVAQVLTNVERFLRLAQMSSAAHHQESRQKKGKGLGFSSWKTFLVRPAGQPDGPSQSVCSRCKYQSKCLKG